MKTRLTPTLEQRTPQHLEAPERREPGRLARFAALACALSVAAPCAGCETGGGDPEIDGGGFLFDSSIDELPPPTRDTDGDFIPDLVEGWQEGRDTDGDGQPDWQDTDSDGDGVPDAIEAGDDDLRTAPIDSDEDGLADYVDEDSDENGLLDRIEGAEDHDGDGILDYADDDDDGDRIPDVEEIGEGAFPRDTDVDGTPDFRDDDADGDTIADRDEVVVDTDGDGTPDYIDLDADNDGWLDAEEAGDGDLDTPPVDTDNDRTPDYRDLDADNDGLSDALEREEGSSHVSEDTDGDGVADLIEIGAGTGVDDPADNPRVRGDFVFVVPYREEAEPPRDTLRFRTNIRRADVYFLFDITGSMSREVGEMRSRVVEILEEISCGGTGVPCFGDLSCAEGEICSFEEGRCVEDPSTSNCIADLWTGVGIYAGFENTYRNLLSLQPDPTLTQSSIPEDADGTGASESLFESVACVADPSACFGALCTRSGIGCPSFRRDAVRTLVTVTDEDNQCTSTACPVVNTAEAAGGRLSLRRINFVGVDADRSNSPREDLRAIGMSAGSVDPSGQPYYYEGQESAVSSAVSSAIAQISRDLSLFVDIDVADAEDDDGDALQFIQRLEVNTATFGCTDVGSTTDVNGDGFDDAFPDLQTGTPVCWDVVVRPNSRVRPGERPQVFIAELTVFGDGSPLDRRRVFFLVPPELPQICPDPPCL